GQVHSRRVSCLRGSGIRKRKECFKSARSEPGRARVLLVPDGRRKESPALAAEGRLKSRDSGSPQALKRVSSTASVGGTSRTRAVPDPRHGASTTSTAWSTVIETQLSPFSSWRIARSEFLCRVRRKS